MEPGTSGTIKQRILIVEDDPRMLQLVCKGLRDVGHVPISARDGDAGFELAMSHDFDSIILDIGLPGRDGFSVARAIRAKKKSPILMLTARDSEADLLRGFDNGADDYLTKPFSFREMLARVNVLGRMSRQRCVPPFQLDTIRLTARRGEELIGLTRSEFLLLAALNARANAVVDRRFLMEAVWGGQQTISANTLDVLVNALRGKVDTASQNKSILTVRGIGYQLVSNGSAECGTSRSSGQQENA